MQSNDAEWLPRGPASPLPGRPRVGPTVNASLHIAFEPASYEGKHMTTPRQIRIFDTTLRDGEQSPGCSMNIAEKMEVAAHLVELGVDILEAGFPIASEGDFESVDAVSRQFPWVQVAALARSTTLDVQRAAASLK